MLFDALQLSLFILVSDIQSVWKRDATEVSEIQSVWKWDAAEVSEIQTSLDFRHSLYFKSLHLHVSEDQNWLLQKFEIA